MNILDMKPHPLCARMPKPAAHVRAALKRSMELQKFDKGEPVVIWNDPAIGEDRILDGLNRRDMAKELGITDIPVARFVGSFKEAAQLVGYRQFGKRNPDKSQSAAMMATFREDMDLTLEEAADMIGASISLMEKASALNGKSKRYARKAIKGEITVGRAVNQLKRTTPESHTDGEDPWIEIQKTRDRLTALEDELVKWSEELDAALDRRGGERIKAVLQSRMKIVAGKSVPGLAMVEEILMTIKKNKPKERCKTCNGTGCQDCGNRRYVTAFELSAMKNAERGTK